MTFKSQVPISKSQINPVTDEMKNSYVSNGVNPNDQISNSQNKICLGNW
jgi:hypothetical protein